MKGCGMFLAIFGATLTILVNPAYANSYANTISDGKCAVLDDVNGCSTPFKLSLPYKDQFTQSCNSHDVCYRCVSRILFLFTIFSIRLLAKRGGRISYGVILFYISRPILGFNRGISPRGKSRGKSLEKITYTFSFF